jgi:hypothetical protein
VFFRSPDPGQLPFVALRCFVGLRCFWHGGLPTTSRLWEHPAPEVNGHSAVGSMPRSQNMRWNEEMRIFSVTWE